MGGMLSRSDHLIRALAEGLTGWMTFQARTGMSPAYSELLLYGPIVSMARNLRWKVEGQYRVEVSKKPGANRTIDFLLTDSQGNDRVAVEVKWAPDKRKRIVIGGDLEKLRLVSPRLPAGVRRFLMVAGKHEIKDGCRDASLRVKPTPDPGTPIFTTGYAAPLTRYGVSVFEVTPTGSGI